MTDLAVRLGYSPISENFEALTIHFNRDGVRHVLLGARGTFSASLAPSAIPRYQFTFTGLLGTISDQNLPAADLTKFIKPAIVSKANTTMTVLGWSSVAESISFDIANQVEPRMLIGDESIQITDRQATGSIVVEARKLAVVNWFDKAVTRERGSIRSSLRQTAPMRFARSTTRCSRSGISTSSRSTRSAPRTLTARSASRKWE